MDAAQGDLFGSGEGGSGQGGSGGEFSEADMRIIASLYSDGGLDPELPEPEAELLWRLCPEAFALALHARMSELPVGAAIFRFREKVLGAADSAGLSANAGAAAGIGRTGIAMRRAALLAAEDHGDPDTGAVREAARKVEHEIARMRGFLRFAPGADGVYLAPCAPDHFILPALGPHFRKRFGGAPWTIVDEKRRLRLRHLPKKPFEFSGTDGSGARIAGSGEWERLWQRYHAAAGRKDRRNPELQRRFLPERYRKYLTEMREGEEPR